MSFLKHLLPAWKRSLDDKSTANAAIMDSLDKELSDLEQKTIESKVLSSLATSTGSWLDQYGKWFGIDRREAELDEYYRQRIIRYILLKRGTIPAIIDAIREFLNDYESFIEIYEPFENVFILNRSTLNGSDKLMGKYYTFAVIDVRIEAPFPPEIIDIINAFKPVGVTVFLTELAPYLLDDTSLLSESSVINSEGTLDEDGRVATLFTKLFEVITEVDGGEFTTASYEETDDGGTFTATEFNTTDGGGF